MIRSRTTPTAEQLDLLRRLFDEHANHASGWPIGSSSAGHTTTPAAPGSPETDGRTGLPPVPAEKIQTILGDGTQVYVARSLDINPVPTQQSPAQRQPAVPHRTRPVSPR